MQLSLLIVGFLLLLASAFRDDEERSWTQCQIGLAFLLAAGIQGLIDNYPF